MKKLALAALLIGAFPASSAIAQETVSLLTPEAIVELPAPDFINELHQREWVSLDEQGKLTGRVVVLGTDGQPEGRIGAKVFISLDGKTLFESVTDSEGSFEVSGLQPGTYAFQSRGEYSFAAFALHVLSSEASSLSSNFEVYASVLPTSRVTAMIAQMGVPSGLSAGSDLYYRNFETDPLGARRKFSSSHQVVLQEGTLVGRVSRPGWTFAEQDLRGTVAQIVKDGEVVASAAVEQDGYFKIADFQPGVYDLFVAGDDGVAILAFEAVQGQGLAGSPRGPAGFVSTQAGVTNCLSCEMVQSPEISSCCGPVVDDGIAGVPADMGMPMAGGGFAGPGGFGGGGLGGGGAGGGLGGGGGGLGGLGGLLGIAGLAAGVVALADDDPGAGTPIVP